jgi:SpoVK/Ycf46/Vps4 family AAA+-type ATPase
MYYLSMKKEISQWATVLDVIESGLNKDIDKMRSYSALLADRLDEDGDKALADRIRRILETTHTQRASRGSTASLSPAQAVFAPVDPESRSAFVDEIKPTVEEAPILNQRVFHEIDRFIQLQRYADQFVREGIPAPRSLLLFGPPGCGKSTTAQYVAKKLGLPLFIVRLDAVMSSFLGTTAKNLRMVFEHAARRAAVLFLDEFDALAKMRDDSNEVGEIKRIVNSLIQNMDTFPRLYVIAATNHEHLLDPAIWRRFDVIVNLPLPDLEERAAFLRRFLGQHEIDENNLRWVAIMTEECTGYDIAQMAIRTRQEKAVNPDGSILYLLVREVWRHLDENKPATHRPTEDKSSIVKFIDSRTNGKVPAKTMEEMTGISDSTVARIRRIKGDATLHGR